MRLNIYIYMQFFVEYCFKSTFRYELAFEILYYKNLSTCSIKSRPYAHHPSVFLAVLPHTKNV